MKDEDDPLKENIEEIGPGLYRITIPLSFGMDSVHTYVLVEEGRVALFDTGPDMPTSVSIFENVLGRIGRSLADVNRVFVSHGHPDHCGFAGRIKDIAGAEIYISEIECEALERARGEQSRANAVRAVFRLHGAEETVIRRFGEILDTFTLVTAPFAADHFLCDGQSIRVGSREICTLSTPGHSRGHVCFHLPAERILIAGDCILPDITPNLSPDPSCPSFQPLESFIASLKRVGELDVQRVYPAHGEPFDNLQARVVQIVEHHHERKAITRQSVTGMPQTASDIARQIFGEDLPAFDKGLALNETCVHLMQLEKEGQIEKLQEDGRIYYIRK